MRKGTRKKMQVKGRGEKEMWREASEDDFLNAAKLFMAAGAVVTENAWNQFRYERYEGQTKVLEDLLKELEKERETTSSSPSSSPSPSPSPSPSSSSPSPSPSSPEISETPSHLLNLEGLFFFFVFFVFFFCNILKCFELRVVKNRRSHYSSVPNEREQNQLESSSQGATLFLRHKYIRI